MAYDNDQNVHHEGEGQPLPHPPIAIPGRDSLAAQIAHSFAYHDPASAALVAQMTLEGMQEVYDDPAELERDQQFYFIMERACEDAERQHVEERTQSAEAIARWDAMTPEQQDEVLRLSPGIKSAD